MEFGVWGVGEDIAKLLTTPWESLTVSLIWAKMGRHFKGQMGCWSLEVRWSLVVPAEDWGQTRSLWRTDNY